MHKKLFVAELGLLRPHGRASPTLFTPVTVR